MPNYISRHKAQHTAENKLPAIARKSDATAYVTTDGKWFYTTLTPQNEVVAEFTAQRPVCAVTGLTIENSWTATYHSVVSKMETKHEGYYHRNNMDQWRVVRDAMERATGSYDSPEAFEIAFDAIMEELQEKAAKKREIARKRQERQEQEDREKEAARIARKRERDEQNLVLRENGYKWSYYEMPSDGYQPAYESSGWHLYASDGREVTVQQALAEIAQGVEDVKAQIEAEKAAEKAADEAEKQAEKDAIDERIAHDDAVRAIGVEVEEFDYSGFKCLYKNSVYSSRSGAFVGHINGVKCGVVFSEYDMQDSSRYYCDNPERAGLSVVCDDDDDDYWTI